MNLKKTHLNSTWSNFVEAEIRREARNDSVMVSPRTSHISHMSIQCMIKSSISVLWLDANEQCKGSVFRFNVDVYIFLLKINLHSQSTFNWGFLRFFLFLTLPGVFLIPYLIILVICGIPMLFMELAVGQYTGRGPIGALGQICPLFKGKSSKCILKLQALSRDRFN